MHYFQVSNLPTTRMENFLSRNLVFCIFVGIVTIQKGSGQAANNEAKSICIYILTKRKDKKRVYKGSCSAIYKREDQ